uniref:Metallothionein 2 n=1 Tax=Mus musculus TaxID=10090 RepID=A0A1D5RLC3_MOUSE
MDPAPALAPANANNANVLPARKAAAPAAPWAVRSAPRAASAKRLPTSAAAVPEGGRRGPHICVNRPCRSLAFFVQP